MKVLGDGLDFRRGGGRIVLLCRAQICQRPTFHSRNLHTYPWYGFNFQTRRKYVVPVGDREDTLTVVLVRDQSPSHLWI